MAEEIKKKKVSGRFISFQVSDPRLKRDWQIWAIQNGYGSRSKMIVAAIETFIAQHEAEKRQNAPTN